MALANVRSVTNKAFILNNFFTSKELDFLFLVDTCLRVDDLSAFSDLCPTNCSILNSSRTSSSGRRIAVIFRKGFKCSVVQTDLYNSFESLVFCVESTEPLLCILIYRPPKINKEFIKEFAD